VEAVARDFGALELGGDVTSHVEALHDGRMWRCTSRMGCLIVLSGFWFGSPDWAKYDRGRCRM
jgi:hypothetical protein